MNENNFEKIEAYLSNSLSSDDRLSFEKQIQDNASLYEDVQAHKVTNSIILEASLLDLRGKLNTLHVNKMSGPAKLSFVKKSMIAVTATVIVGAGYLFLDKGTDLFEVFIEDTPLIVLEQNEKPSNGNDKEIFYRNEESVIIETSDKSLPQNEIELIPEVETKKVIPTHAEPKRVVVDICSSVEIGTVLELIPTCVGANRGGVIVEKENTSGGTSPYLYSINGESYDGKGEFLHLGAGDYSFYIKDANGCVVKKDDWVRIKSTSCK